MLAFFIVKMIDLWNKFYPLLSKEKKIEWAKRYKKRYGKDFIPPEKAIQIESLSEIDKLMREKPNPTERK